MCDQILLGGLYRDLLIRRSDSKQRIALVVNLITIQNRVLVELLMISTPTNDYEGRTIHISIRNMIDFWEQL